MSTDIKAYAYYPVQLSSGEFVWNQIYYIVELNAWFGVGPRTRLLNAREYTLHLLSV